MATIEGTLHLDLLPEKGVRLMFMPRGERRSHQGSWYDGERLCVARELFRHVFEMDAYGQGHEHAWPGPIGETDVPGIDDWLMDAEYSRPGCLITWYENDAINACFDEEAQHMGENGPCQPNVALPIHLESRRKNWTTKCDMSSITPARCFGRWRPLPRSSNSLGTSTMNISVNIGSCQDFRLSRAPLVYGALASIDLQFTE